MGGGSWRWRGEIPMIEGPMFYGYLKFYGLAPCFTCMLVLWVIDVCPMFYWYLRIQKKREKMTESEVCAQKLCRSNIALFNRFAQTAVIELENTSQRQIFWV